MKKSKKVKYCRCLSLRLAGRVHAMVVDNDAHVVQALSAERYVNTISDLLECQANCSKDVGKQTKRDTGAHAEAGPGAGEAGPRLAKIMKLGDNDVEDIRGKCKGTQHAVLATLGNHLVYLLCKVMLVIVGPVRARHGHDLVVCATRVGSVRHSASMAVMSWVGPLLDTQALLHDPAKLTSMGFANPAEKVVADSAMCSDATLAKYTVLFMCNLLGRRLLSGLSYSWSLPMKFAQLLHQDRGVVQAGLAELKQWWAVLQEAEKVAHRDGFVQGMLHHMIWPSFQWPRKLLITLREYGFQHVHGSVRQELLDLFQGLANKKPMEDVFHELKAMESKSQ